MPLVSVIFVDDATKVALCAAQTANGGEDPNPRFIDNPLANSLGYGTLVGHWAFAAHLFNHQTGFDQLLAAYNALDPLPAIRIVDVEYLSMPLSDD